MRLYVIRDTVRIFERAVVIKMLSVVIATLVIESKLSLCLKRQEVEDRISPLLADRL